MNDDHTAHIAINLRQSFAGTGWKTVTSPRDSLLDWLQKTVSGQYRAAPVEARVTDRAITTGIAPDDPVHCEVMPMPDRNEVVPIGVHRAVGGKPRRTDTR